MRIAIVGNGPSAAGKGAEIDAADLVVRMNGFSAVAALNAGQRLDVWAWFGSGRTCRRLDGVPPSGNYEVWATLPLSRCRPFVIGHVGDAERLIQWSSARRIRWVTEGEFGEQAAAIGAWPSTGFTAAWMARREHPSAQLLLYGFDALHPSAPGWGDARAPWRGVDATAHNFEAEKRVLRALPGVELR